MPGDRLHKPRYGRGKALYQSTHHYKDFGLLAFYKHPGEVRIDLASPPRADLFSTTPKGAEFIMFDWFNKPRLLLSAVALLAPVVDRRLQFHNYRRAGVNRHATGRRRRDGADCGRHRTFRRPDVRGNPSTHCCYRRPGGSQGGSPGDCIHPADSRNQHPLVRRPHDVVSVQPYDRDSHRPGSGDRGIHGQSVHQLGNEPRWQELDPESAGRCAFPLRVW